MENQELKNPSEVDDLTMYFSTEKKHPWKNQELRNPWKVDDLTTFQKES